VRAHSSAQASATAGRASARPRFGIEREAKRRRTIGALCAAWARPEGSQREATVRYSALLEHGRNDVSGVWDDWYTLGLTLLDALGRGTSPGLDLMLMYAAAHSCQ
jgi:hypothetical protein